MHARRLGPLKDVDVTARHQATRGSARGPAIVINCNCFSSRSRASGMPLTQQHRALHTEAAATASVYVR